MDNSEKNYTLEMTQAFDTVPPAQDTGWFSIFNTPEFFWLHKGGSRGCFMSLRDQGTGKIVGRVHFTETEPGRFISPFRGTFGGFEFAETDMRLIECFVHEAERHLVEMGARSIEVALKPFAHAPAACSCLFNVLARRGYALTVQDLSYALQVLPGGMEPRMQRNNQKKLRKCQREGFVFVVAETPEQQRAAYDAVALNRSSKGYAISMTYEQVCRMQQLYPDRIHFFTVTHGSAVIAGAVCIAVSRDILYVFYWGDIPGFETFSPVVLLADGIYAFAQQRGFQLLDAGRSTDKSVPNTGLIRFKEKLGFEASLKLTFRKELP